jgi:hypothetical protein
VFGFGKLADRMVKGIFLDAVHKILFAHVGNIDDRFAGKQGDILKDRLFVVAFAHKPARRFALFKVILQAL